MNKKILVVDDEEIQANIIADILERKSYTVMKAYGALTPETQPNQPTQGQGKEKGVLGQQPPHRPDGHLLAQETVEAESQGQAQGDPGRLAGKNSQVDRSGRGQKDRRYLPPGEPLAQEDHPHQDVDQGVDVVA